MKTIYKNSFTNSLFYRFNYPWIVKAIVILAVLVNLCLLVSATTYNLTATGKWTAINIWSPSYPGDIIGSGDTVIIDQVVTANVPLTIFGTLIINEEAAIIGNKEIVISGGGTFINYGNSVARSIINDGTLINHLILESSENIVNNGTMINNETMVVGIDFINSGVLTGSEGMVMSNNEIMNNKGGEIQGTLDLCAALTITNYGNIDSMNLSICGIAVQQDIVDWKVNLTGEFIQIRLEDPKLISYSYISIEKSVDGKSFNEIKAVQKNDFSKYDHSFTLHDDAPVTASIYYRIKVVDQYGIVSYAPKVEFRSGQTASAEK